MEILVWLAFFVFFSILQSLKKKKPGQQKPPVDASENGQRPTTLQDALREIGEALREAQNPQPPFPVEDERIEVPKPASKPIPRPATTQQREPEFHSLERNIPERRLETKTMYETKVYKESNLEAEKTYEDAFPTSTYYEYKHAHMEDASPVFSDKKKKTTPADTLRSRLKDPNYLSEAFVIQEILGKPLSKR